MCVTPPPPPPFQFPSSLDKWSTILCYTPDKSYFKVKDSQGSILCVCYPPPPPPFSPFAGQVVDNFMLYPEKSYLKVKDSQGSIWCVCYPPFQFPSSLDKWSTILCYTPEKSYFKVKDG